MKNIEFDEFSQNYQSLLDRSVSLAGETSDYFAEYKAVYLTRILGREFSGKILDYGCGVGLLSRFLRKHLPNTILHGYDVSHESIRMVDHELSRKGVFTSDPGALHADYNVTVVANVMHHVPGIFRQNTVSHLASMLVPGGRLIVFEHNPWNPLTRWVVQHCPFDTDAVLLHKSEIRGYMKNARLQPLRDDYIVFFPRILSFLRPLEPALGWLPLGAQYSFIGQKHG